MKRVFNELVENAIREEETNQSIKDLKKLQKRGKKETCHLQYNVTRVDIRLKISCYRGKNQIIGEFPGKFFYLKYKTANKPKQEITLPT